MSQLMILQDIRANSRENWVIFPILSRNRFAMS